MAAMAAGVRSIAALPDPVGEVIDGQRLPNGLDVRKVRVPLGVVAVVYEARPERHDRCGGAMPEVGQRDRAPRLELGRALECRAGRGRRRGRECRGAARRSAVAVAGGGREELAELATQTGVVDLIIPRGGEGLKHALKDVATVPVIYAASGNCHVYVDASADLDGAQAIAAQREATAARRLQCRRDAARPRGRRRGASCPAWRGHCPRPVSSCMGTSEPAAAAPGVVMDAAGERGLGHRYLALELAVGVVDSTESAIEHINAARQRAFRGDRHPGHGRRAAFQLQVDAACVYVNASTRFTDGGEFGMGAEIGNSTQKLHARGPIGLRELCTFKYLVQGSGHIRP